jgi:hypothetical protein
MPSVELSKDGNGEGRSSAEVLPFTIESQKGEG